MKYFVSHLRTGLVMPAVFLLMIGLIGATVAQETDVAKPKQESDKQDKASETKQDDEVDGDDVKPFDVEIRDGRIVFSASGKWEKVKPRSRIVEFEIKVPKEKGDTKDGRLTIMGAGGTIDANIDRWKKQFEIAKDAEDKDMMAVMKKKINDQQVTMVDITGTFIDAPGGPFSGGQKIERPDYRMLAAIIETEMDGNYFVKLYGPKKTIGKHFKRFKKMIDSVKVGD
ncbi:MAG: hypothetical protein AAFN77_21865 [Planctomycetota bacterium]